MVVVMEHKRRRRLNKLVSEIGDRGSTLRLIEAVMTCTGVAFRASLRRVES
jgi:hypothetical protein